MNKNMLVFAVLLLVIGGSYASSVSRSFSDTVIEVGTDLTVTLTVDVTNGETYYAIEETIPGGWVIKDAGTGSSNTGASLKWLVIEGAIDTTYTYVLTAPSSNEITSFSGSYMFEGMSSINEISGERDVTVKCMLMSTLLNYVDQWFRDEIGMPTLIEKIAEWKAGC